MLKLVGMLLRLYRPKIQCRSCGYTGRADLRYRTLLPWLALMTIAAALYIAFAAVFLGAGFYFLPNWIVGIPFALVALHFLFLWTPDLFCPNCGRS